MERVKKIAEGHPNLIDHMIDGRIGLVMNTPSGKEAQEDDSYIRKSAIKYKILYITTTTAALAATNFV